MQLQGIYYIFLFIFKNIFFLFINNFYLFNRRRLRLKYVHITFLPCFAHQMNLFIGEIFKESEKFKEASIKAIKIALFFKSSNNKYFISQLRTLQKEAYGKYIQIAIGNDTRWNSHYECFHTLIKSKAALRVLYTFFILFLNNKFILIIFFII